MIGKTQPCHDVQRKPIFPNIMHACIINKMPPHPKPIRANLVGGFATHKQFNAQSCTYDAH